MNEEEEENRILNEECCLSNAFLLLDTAVVVVVIIQQSQSKHFGIGDRNEVEARKCIWQRLPSVNDQIKLLAMVVLYSIAKHQCLSVCLFVPVGDRCRILF